MTYCDTLGKTLLKKIKEGKTLDEMGSDLCGKSVKNPRQKAIRLIRELLGEEALIENAKSIEYDVEKAELGKKPKKSLRKIKTETDDDSKDNNRKLPEKPVKKEISLDEVMEYLIQLIKSSNENTVIAALEAVLHKEIHIGD